MAETVNCGSCEHDKISTFATKWCADCDEGFCENCLAFHKSSKKLREHHIIAISDYVKIKSLTLDHTCGEHGKTFHFFCPTHEKILCHMCLQNGHECGKCTDIRAVLEACKEAKTSNAFRHMEVELKGVLDNIEKGINLHTDNLSFLEEQIKKVKQKVMETRESINKKLDQLERKLKNNLVQIQERRSSDLQTILNDLHQKQKEINKLVENCSIVRQLGSNLQAFISKHKMNEQICLEKISVSVLFSRLNNYAINFIPAKEIDLIDKLEELGKIELKPMHGMEYREPKSEEAQLPVMSNTDARSIELLLKQELSANGTDLNFGVMLPGQRLLFGDFESKRLLTHYEDGSRDDDIILPEYVHSATAVDSNRVAVTCLKKPEIHIIDVKERTVIKNLAMPDCCCGLFYYNDKLYVSVSESGSIMVIDLNGTVCGEIPIYCKTTHSLYVEEGRIYYCDEDNGELCCIDFTGKFLWSFKDKRINSTSTVLLGRNGHIFLTCPYSNVLIDISDNGKRNKIILDETNKLSYPIGFSCDNERNVLLICNENGYVALYDIIY